MHITKGNVFDDLGLDAEQLLDSKIKAEIMFAIRQHIEKRGYTQAETAAILKEHQPTVSRLMNGRINSITIDKLLRYAGRLNLGADIRIISLAKPHTGKQTRKSHAAESPRKQKSYAHA